MPIQLQALRQAALRGYRTGISKNLTAARASGEATAFLCHSHKDQEYARGLQVTLEEQGWKLYIDWEDTAMPDQPNRETARRIQQKIRELGWFLFLATPNSTDSRWCPWEIGYADSKKTHDRILIIPTTDVSGNWYGNEYLQLYRRIEIPDGGGLAAFSAGQNQGGVWIRNL